MFLKLTEQEAMCGTGYFWEIEVIQTAMLKEDAQGK